MWTGLPCNWIKIPCNGKVDCNIADLDSRLNYLQNAIYSCATDKWILVQHVNCKGQKPTFLMVICSHKQIIGWAWHTLWYVSELCQLVRAQRSSLAITIDQLQDEAASLQTQYKEMTSTFHMRTPHCCVVQELRTILNVISLLMETDEIKNVKNYMIRVSIACIFWDSSKLQQLEPHNSDFESHCRKNYLGLNCHCYIRVTVVIPQRLSAVFMKEAIVWRYRPWCGVWIALLEF